MRRRPNIQRLAWRLRRRTPPGRLGFAVVAGLTLLLASQLGADLTHRITERTAPVRISRLPQVTDRSSSPAFTPARSARLPTISSPGTKGAARPSGGCRIVSVIDGDTVKLACPGAGTQRARLTGFDTPEVFSPKCASERARGNRATQELKRRIRRASRISIERHGRDRYGRILAEVRIDGQSLATQMIASGHARAYSGGRRRGWCS